MYLISEIINDRQPFNGRRRAGEDLDGHTVGSATTTKCEHFGGEGAGEMVAPLSLSAFRYIAKCTALHIFSLL